jgi:hypothetical protein
LGFCTERMNKEWLADGQSGAVLVVQGTRGKGKQT